MLPYAIESVLGQERQDFELLVICDGAPPETAACAQGFAARDPRIKVHVHPKGERYGESYRHEALREAGGQYVCQLGDDDLWLPNHVTEMAVLLQDADFGNLTQIELEGDKPIIFDGDLADPAARERILTQHFTFFGPTAAGYRLQAYRSLPVGWTPAAPRSPPACPVPPPDWVGC